jgi:coenzyme F420-0:L-glutamate ligase / coenzyme F420-1:gamma-L-glutamate ligase
MARVQIFGVDGLPEIVAGMDLAEMIFRAAVEQGDPIEDGDVVLVTSKIVSKAEGCAIELNDVVPSDFAQRWSEKWDKDPRVTEVVLRESKRVIRQIGPVLITETHHGFPDASCRAQRGRFAELGVAVAVIMTDTFGRPWREGQTDIAIGVAGINPLHSYIGETDPHGHEFRVQEICTADELAGAGELVKGNTSRVPVAVVRGHVWEPDESASMSAVLRDSERDLFR